MLAATSLIVKTWRFRRIARLADRHPTRALPADPAAAIALVGWAVHTAARRARFRAVCIEQGLAAHLMLRRRGVPSHFHYGVTREGAGLAAHVWVRAAGRDVVGCDEAHRFRLMATFPADQPGGSAQR